MNKKLLITILTIFLSSFIFSQIETPQPSPLSKFSQKVGLDNVNIEYSRPSARQRIVFGTLIPFGEKWRTGANENTKITFEDNVKIQNKLIKKGTYSIYTIPNLNSWNLIFYKKYDNWGLPRDWDDDLVEIEVSANTISLPFYIETFTISLNNLNNNGCTLDIFWENTLVSFNINSLTQDKVVKSINNTLNDNPSSQDYYKAAVFYLEEDLDIKKAKLWIDKCSDLRQDLPYWMLNQKALIYHAFGSVDKSIEIAKKGLKLANETNIKDSINTLKETLHYVSNN
ncbi:DUF2911 domain-containing protein [Flavobacteriaceae bacterium]|nr:DUF2911 domain-containing protein [Flavobacteriaceae bacterium]MDB4024439.1 DUF2911 domain-containing protein [Flavobacteriaceae bacterium]MDC1460024.1 DUF2911 domain-containing protein [Flavobacteriaceae bacterium]